MHIDCVVRLTQQLIHVDPYCDDPRQTYHREHGQHMEDMKTRAASVKQHYVVVHLLAPPCAMTKKLACFKY